MGKENRGYIIHINELGSLVIISLLAIGLTLGACLLPIVGGMVAASLGSVPVDKVPLISPTPSPRTIQVSKIAEFVCGGLCGAFVPPVIFYIIGSRHVPNVFIARTRN